MEPASAPPSLSLATLFSMTTSSPPSWHSPLLIHDPAMESVIIMIWSMGLVLKMSLRKSGARWMPSQMSSSFRSSSRRPVPIMPISRWWSGVMALPKWVRCVRPASFAARVCAWVASEWAADEEMPRDFASRMTVQALGLHGAMERTFAGAMEWISFNSSMFGSRTY